ncbi:MAG: hypothetical protein K6U08_05770 [Firmicutes bacterium]|nr:hypothetical protein [Bacillota bacterium]
MEKRLVPVDLKAVDSAKLPEPLGRVVEEVRAGAWREAKAKDGHDAYSDYYDEPRYHKYRDCKD